MTVQLITLCAMIAMTVVARLTRRVLSFPAMMAVGLVLVTVLTVTQRFDDPDLWWHLKVGAIVWNSHSIPQTDLFSYTTHAHAWTAHEWLAQLSMYAAYHLGGYTGLMLWLCVVASLTFLLVFALCQLVSGDPMIALLGGLMAWFFGTVGFAVRPLMLGHLFFATELLILELGRSRNRRWLWLLPPLFGVWVNCHGSYFFGIAVLAVYWACSYVNGNWGLLAAEACDRGDRNRLGLVLVLSTAALFLNPVGVQVLVYPLDTLFHQSAGMNSVEEWLPPDLREARTMGVIGAILALFVIKLLRASALQLRDLVLLGMASGLAFRHARMIFLFGIVASPILCRALRAVWTESRRRDRPVLNAAMMFAFFAVIIGTFPNEAALANQVRKSSPVGALEYVQKAGLSGPILNEYRFGGYLIWAFPREKVFIDGRADVFDWTGVMQEYGRWAMLVDDPTALLDKYRVRLCLLSKGAPMTHVLPYLPGWRKAYADDVSMVFVRW